MYSSFKIPDVWTVKKGDVQHACCRSDSSQRTLPDILDIFAAILPVHATVGFFSEYMDTCMFLRGATTLSSTIRTKNKAAISMSEIGSVPFVFSV